MLSGDTLCDRVTTDDGIEDVAARLKLKFRLLLMVRFALCNTRESQGFELIVFRIQQTLATNSALRNCHGVYVASKCPCELSRRDSKTHSTSLKLRKLVWLTSGKKGSRSVELSMFFCSLMHTLKAQACVQPWVETLRMVKMAS